MQCPGCDLELYKVNQDINSGKWVEYQLFWGIKGIPDPVNREKCKCGECGKPWARYYNGTRKVQLHIKDQGWV